MGGIDSDKRKKIIKIVELLGKEEIVKMAKCWGIDLEEMKDLFLQGSLNSEKEVTRHEKIPREKLLKDVLTEIRKNHEVNKCPLCGNDLTENACSMGINIFHRPDGCLKDEYKKCDTCKIIWHLNLQNWTDYMKYGMIKGKGHFLFLEGWTNCFCKYPVFEHHLLIEHSEPYHASLGYPCPNIKVPI